MKLVVFDVDGVVLDIESGFLELAKALGKQEEFKALHEEYHKRRRYGPWGLDSVAKVFAGIEEKKLKEVSREIVSKSLMQGVEDVIAELKRRGYQIAFASSNCTEIVENIGKRFGAVFTSGNKFEVKRGKITGVWQDKVDRYVKAQRLKEFIQSEGITPQDIFIVGDSVTDVPMAEYGILIAFNPKDAEVEQKAKHVIKKKDLREVLKFIL